MKSLKTLLAGVLIIALLCASAAFADQPTAVAHQVQSPIQIDGTLDEWNLNDPIVLDQESQDACQLLQHFPAE